MLMQFTHEKHIFDDAPCLMSMKSLMTKDRLTSAFKSFQPYKPSENQADRGRG